MLDYPGGAREFDEILAYYTIEEEDRKASVKRQELLDKVNNASQTTRGAVWGGPR